MKLALVGMAPSRSEILDEQDAFDEIWTINYWYKFIPELNPDRVFDMHDLYFYRDSAAQVERNKKHWEYIQSEKNHRFIAPLEYGGLAEKYPLDKVAPLITNFHRKPDEYIKMWASSFDYLMSLAIAEEWDEIHLYGWQMGWGTKGSETEYIYQLPGMAFWTGYAVSRGIDVWVDGKTPLFKAKMYTYNGGSMITRQTLESFKKAYNLQLEQAQAKFHKKQGELETFIELYKENPNNQAYKNSVESKQKEMSDAYMDVVRTETALNTVINFIENVDMEETNTEIESRLIKIIDNSIAKALREADERT